MNKIQIYRSINHVKRLKEKQIKDNQILSEVPYYLMKILLEDITKNKFNDNLNLIPPNWNNLYFLDKTPTSKLGLDGYDDDFAPGAPYNHRLWKSGELLFNNNNWLKIGHKTQLITSCNRIEQSFIDNNKGHIALITIQKEYSKMK